MSQNADNDNTNARADTTAATTTDDWHGYGNAGNTALAAAANPVVGPPEVVPTPEPSAAPSETAAESEPAVAEAQSPEPEVPAVEAADAYEAPALEISEAASQSETVTEQSTALTPPAEPLAASTAIVPPMPPPVVPVPAEPRSFAFSVSNAASLDDLGVSMPQRPVPGDRPSHIAVQTRPAAPVRTDEPVAVSPSNAHLFNQPRIEPGAIDQAVPPGGARSAPLTQQPGFLAGLVAATAVGGALYLYLV